MSPDLAAADLARSGISTDQAAAAGMYPVDRASDIYPDFKALPATVIPYYTPDGSTFKTFKRDGETLPFVRVRYLVTPKTLSRFPKYTQPRDSGIHAYFPQGAGIDWPAVLADGAQPILITEGEKKALVGCLNGAATVGLGGVFNYQLAGELLPDLAAAQWRGRPTYIVFDSDAASNPNVLLAETRLATELSLKRAANVFIVRLPPTSSGDKQGLDDFISANGWNAFVDLLEAAQQVRKSDAEILGMNLEAAWLEEDGAVYDVRDRTIVRKSDFLVGSRFSTRKVTVPNPKGGAPKEVSLSSIWLTHPNARRYRGLTFAPSDDRREVPHADGGVCLNLWEGLPLEAGDATPFVTLTNYLFAHLPPEHRAIPLKLLAYKVQNVGHKIPIGMVLVGRQGSGKSLWAAMVREAFGRYGTSLSATALRDNFNGWTERSLIAVLDDAKPEDLKGAIPNLYKIVSDSRTFLNEKYRAAKQIDCLASVIITSNFPQVAAFSGDDRRMFVIDTPNQQSREFYDPMYAMLREGRCKHILHYLANMDLQGWTPPNRAPMTQEKVMAYQEGLTPVQQLAHAMLESTSNSVELWIASAIQVAQASTAAPQHTVAQRARDTIQILSQIQIRPWYTSTELAALFPALSLTMDGSPAGVISAELREAGIKYLRSKDDPRGFMWNRQWQQFLIVADHNDWTQPLSQKDFDRLMKQWPKYAHKPAQGLR